ncbi:hypothetical protein [Leifsonia sp. 71-9]|uniref:hypothetical protein n=1 Tax=Leifsonia sp. 71-9 TaxID=1895934 RepID=UPI00092B532E|nr:hypothetical protein [Leifsonia sp. 71-9]OJX72790.1 MAG: hypothetical protein BGO91_13535 [Leifsonia sp. 71-9]
MSISITLKRVLVGTAITAGIAAAGIGVAGAANAAAPAAPSTSTSTHSVVKGTPAPDAGSPVTLQAVPDAKPDFSKATPGTATPIGPVQNASGSDGATTLSK